MWLIVPEFVKRTNLGNFLLLNNALYLQREVVAFLLVLLAHFSFK